MTGGVADRDLLEGHGMRARRRSGAPARGVVPLVLAILAAAFATIGAACEDSHVDMYFGTDAGTDFDAPAHEAGTDAATDATADDGGVTDDGGASD